MELFIILHNEISKIINIELFFTLIFIVLNILIILIIAKILNKKNFDIRYESEEEKRYLIPIITITSIFGFIFLLIIRYATLKGIKKQQIKKQ
jgi:ABC-type sugar transport system permease subunit